MKRIFTFLSLLCAYTITIAQAPAWTWAKTSSGSSSDVAVLVGADAVGNVYSAGTYSGSITWGGTTLSGGSIYLCKYDTSGNVQWAKSASGNTSAGVYGMATDAAGNTYIGGYFDGSSITFGAYTLHSTGSWHSFLVKYDASGNVKWAIDAGGNGNQVQSVAINPLGGVSISGIYQNTTCTIGSTTLQSDGDNDSYAARIDTNGNGLWAKRIVGTSWDDVYGIGTDGSGNTYVSGYSGSSTLTFGETISISNTAYSIFIGKFDGNGNAVWANNTNGSGYNWVTTMAVDCNGNSFLTGYVDGTTNFSGALSISDGSAEYFLAKYNTSGNAVWVETIGGATGSIGYDVATDVAGNIYTTGYFSGSSATFGGTTLNTNQTETSFLVKYDAGGNVSFALNPAGASGSTGSSGSGVGVDNFGNILSCGSFSGGSLIFGNTTLNNNGSNDAFVARIDAQISSGGSLPTITPNGATSFCQGDSVILTASAGGNYFWSDSATTQSVTIKNSGSYTVMEGGSGCNATSLPTVVTVIPSPKAGTITGVNSICNGSPVNLKDSASSAQNRQWQSSSSINNFTNIANATDSLYANSFQQTTYFRVYVSNGSCADTSAIFALTVNPLPTPVVATTDSLFCSYDSSLINSSGPYRSYSWSNGDTTSYTYVNATGEYWLTVTDANGCAGVSNQQGIVVFPHVSVPTISTSDSVFCSYNSSLINSSGSYSSYNWNNGDTTSYTYVNVSGEYWLTVTDANGCSGVSNQQGIVVHPPVPVPTISASDSIICASDSAKLQSSGNYSSYLWSNNDTLPYTYVNGAGGYWVSVTDNNGCTAVSGHQEISTYPATTVSVDVHGDTLSSFNALSYQWLFNDSLIPGATSPVYMAQQSGEYSVQIVDTNGCKELSNNTPVAVLGIMGTATSLLNIYPDPFSSTIFINSKSSTSTIEAIEMYNVLGEKVLERKADFNSSHLLLDVSALPAGAYYIYIKATGTEYIKKMIKE